MKILRILGILVLLAGVACLFISNYITNQVNEGKIQIEEGQKKVDQSKSLFSMSPVTKPVGKQITASGQKKINEGKDTVAYYEQVAQTLKTSGIVLIIVGAGMTLFGFFGSRKKRR